MAADWSIKSNDRLPTLQATLKSNGVAIDLTTAASVKFIMKTIVGNTVKVNSPAVIISAASGIVEYQWAAADTNVPGSYQAEFEITWPGSKKQSVPTLSYITVDVLADLDGA